MQTLVQRIESGIEKEKVCFVRPDELHRVWPEFTEFERETVVRSFAHKHGWRVFTYSRALGAMFVREK